MPLLAVDGLTLSAAGRPLVSGLSFALEAGERMGLIGESGSGKSLTALAVTGLLPRGIAARGSVRLAGREVLGAPDRALVPLRGAAVAVVFQEPLSALDPLMTLGRQVAEPLRRRLRREGRPAGRRAVRREVLDLLAEAAVADPARIAAAYPYEVSGGQRQRVAIAMALACRPALLIADEPTTALDVTTQAEILDLLDRVVRERGMALLFIGHDLPVVARIAERVTVLHRGQAVEAGPVGDVLVAPAAAHTRELVAAARSFERALDG